MTDDTYSKHLRTDKDDVGEDSAESITVYSKSIGTEHHVVLGDSIDDPHRYTDLIFKLRSAGSADIFHVYLNNFGGYLHSGVGLISAIQASPAVVHMVVTAGVYSMASILALAGDVLELERGAAFMFHDFSAHESGKGNEIAKAIDHANSYFKDLLLDICHPFLTVKEIDAICEGQDVYVPYDDAVRRVVKIRKGKKCSKS